jgi:hypothetical protein
VELSTGEKEWVMHQSVRAAFPSFSQPLEGRLPFMYLDVKGLVSTGVGNLLDADDPGNFGSNPNPLPDIFTLDWSDKDSHEPAGRNEIEEEYRKVKFSGTAHATTGEKELFTRLRISERAIDTLVADKLASFEMSLRGREPYAALADWPGDGQLGLFSMAWAMGPFFRFPEFQGAASAGDWLTMARECRMTEAGNPGVVPRNVRNALLFTLAGWVAVPPPGDVTQLVFDPGQPLDAFMRSGNLPVPLNLVIGVQTALETLGFDPRGLDGVAGPGTRAALVAFQGAHGLTLSPQAGGIDDIPAETVGALAARLDGSGVSYFP